MARLRFTSSEATNADLRFQIKGSHKQIHVIDLIKTVFFNRLNSKSASNKLFRMRIVVSFSKVIFTEVKIRCD